MSQRPQPSDQQQFIQQPSLGVPQSNGQQGSFLPQGGQYLQGPSQLQYPITTPGVLATQYQPQYQPQYQGVTTTVPQYQLGQQYQQISQIPATQTSQQATVQQTGQVIKGESRIEYIPYTKEITEYVTQEVVEYVPREKKITDYYAVEYITEHIPQVIQEKYIEYVPVETVKERTEYQAVTKQSVIQQPNLEQSYQVQQQYTQYQPQSYSQIIQAPQTTQVIGGNYYQEYQQGYVPQTTQVITGQSYLPQTQVISGQTTIGQPQIIGGQTQFLGGQQQQFVGGPQFVGGAQLAGGQTTTTTQVFGAPQQFVSQPQQFVSQPQQFVSQPQYIPQGQYVSSSSFVPPSFAPNAVQPQFASSNVQTIPTQGWQPVYPATTSQLPQRLNPSIYGAQPVGNPSNLPAGAQQNTRTSYLKQ
ncbi:hypothetical protein pb186bvf_012521 [Paramecium bursaria]